VANVEDAINDLFFLERRFKNLMEVIPELQKYSSLATAIAERKDQLKKADELLAATKTDIAAVKAEALSLQEKILSDEADAASKAKASQEQAKQEAKDIIVSAQAKAEGIVTKAEKKAQELDSASEAVAKELEETKAALALQKSNYEDILTRINELKSRL